MTVATSNASQQPAVSVVVPTYKEVENIDELVTRVSNTFDELDTLFEIIIVDDASRDGTDEEVARLQSEGRNVRMIERTDERGLSSAVLRGFNEAKGDLLVCMDADLSHPPEALPQLLKTIDGSGDSVAAPHENAEMVIGSRYVEGGSTDAEWGVFRLLNSRIATWLARPFTRAKDPMAGFFALPREVFQRTTAWDPIGYKIGLEILVKAGCRRVAEVPIHFSDRTRGESKLSLKEQLNYVRHLWRLGQHKYKRTFQFLNFAMVGATGMVVDLAIFALLMRSGMSIPIARAIAIAVAICWNFVGNELWTFRPENGSIAGRFQKFIVACGLGALLSYGITVAGTQLWTTFQTHPMPLALFGILVGTGFNYTLARRWVFKATASSS